MRFLPLLLLAAPLFASNLLTYNIYERNERVDIMLSFDSPYEGGIKQQAEAGATVLLLNDLVSEEEIEKSVNSPVLESVFISQQDPETARVELRAEEPIAITASKTADKFGLRIRVTKLAAAQPAARAQSSAASSGAIATREEPDMTSKYLAVVGVLLLLLFVLIIVKRKVAKKADNLKSSVNSNLNYRVDSNLNYESRNVASDFGLSGNGEVKILFERSLDPQNKVVLLEYEARKYLVLTGASNVLLDRFGEENINDEQGFEVFFEENKRKLERFLEGRRDSLENYEKNLIKD